MDVAKAKSAFSKVALPMGVLVAILCAAQTLKYFNLLPIFVPGPWDVVMQIWTSPTLVSSNVLPTLYKASAGYLIAAIVAVCAGSLAVLVRMLYGPIYNFGVCINSVPIIATAPLIALTMGNGPQVQIAIAALASQFPMLVGTMQGLRSADARQLELMHVLSASKLQTLRYLLAPGALPFMLAGFKIAAPSAVLGAITAEWVGADRGIGALMLYALFSYDTPKVWLSVLLTCALAASGYGLMALVQHYVLWWDRDVELES